MAEEYSFADVPKPFKNLNYKRDAKRSKSVKQIMALERDRVDNLAKLERDKKRLALENGGHEIIEAGQEGTSNQEVITCKFASSLWMGIEMRGSPFWDVDATVEAPPSLVPQKKYCDVTGLEVGHLPVLPLQHWC